MEINKQDIIRYWMFLGHKNQTEIRAIAPRWDETKKFPVSVYISNEKDLIDQIEKINGKYNVYIGINERKENGKEDKDIEYITNIGHDIDAHESGEEGFAAAGKIAINILEGCKKDGLKEPLLLNSGRGYWIIHHIKPIENTEENIKKIKEFGSRIKQKYEIKPAEIDTSVYNPSRIARVAGTLNISDKENFVLSSIINSPNGEEDEKLTEEILSIEIENYKSNLSVKNNNSICSFMDYCLTHEIPKGERHKVISRNIAIYLYDHPDRKLLTEQYCKIQKGSPTELDQWFKGIAKRGIENCPFSIGELVKFTKKYKIPFEWKNTPEYKEYINNKKAEKNLNKEIEKEKKAERFGKAIKYFTDKKHLAEQFLKVQPIYFDKSKLWWIWNFDLSCWDLCDETDIMNYISDNSEADTINSTEKNEILEALRQVSRKYKPKEMPKTWIQFKNYIIDLETNQKIKSSPEYFVTNQIPWEIQESEETPTMDKIFGEWVGKENIKTLYEIIAYCMINDYPINRIFCFIGAGMNGKSKYLELLRKFIGENNCCSTELDTLISSRFEVTRLYKKLVCQMGETNFGEMSKTSLLKKLSGGDLIGFEYKNKNPFEDINKAKIIISTNNLPTTTDKTIGFYRRWMIIDFPNQFTEKKDILKDIPEEEYNNLCMKSIKILKELLLKREFTNEGTIEERTKRYEDRSDPLEKFIKEFTEEDPNGSIWKFEFEKRLNEWCENNKFRKMSEMIIGKKMKEKGVEQAVKFSDWFIEGQKKQLRAWIGLKWKQ